MMGRMCIYGISWSAWDMAAYSTLMYKHWHETKRGYVHALWEAVVMLYRHIDSTQVRLQNGVERFAFPRATSSPAPLVPSAGHILLLLTLSSGLLLLAFPPSNSIPLLRNRHSWRWSHNLHAIHPMLPSILHFFAIHSRRRFRIHDPGLDFVAPLIVDVFDIEGI